MNQHVHKVSSSVTLLFFFFSSFLYPLPLCPSALAPLFSSGVLAAELAALLGGLKLKDKARLILKQEANKGRGGGGGGGGGGRGAIRKVYFLLSK